MTPAPRVVTPFALLLTLLGVALVVTWPSRSIDGNDAWFVVAGLRTAALALWGWFAGLTVGRRDDLPAGHVPMRLVLAGVVTAPLEMAAHAGGVVTTPVAWNLAYAPLLAVSAFLVSVTLTRALRRRGAGITWAASLGVLLLLGWMDLRVGPPVALPWVVPGSPSLAAVLVNVGLLVTTGASRVAWQRRRRDGSP